MIENFDRVKDYGLMVEIIVCPECSRFYGSDWNGFCECGYIHIPIAAKAGVLSDSTFLQIYEPDWIIA